VVPRRPRRTAYGHLLAAATTLPSPRLRPQNRHRLAVRRKRPGWCNKRRWDLPPDFEYEICHLSLLWTRPKTQAGERHIPVGPGLLHVLRELHADQGVNPHDLVWHRPDGKPIGPRDDYRAWHNLLLAAGVIEDGETLSMHVARHTAASLLRGGGVDEQTRMEILRPRHRRRPTHLRPHIADLHTVRRENAGIPAHSVSQNKPNL
jgi:hypothetical protein